MDWKKTRIRVKKKFADSGRSSCSVYIFLGEGVVFLFFVHFIMFGCWENGQNEMNVQLHQYIYAEITHRLGCDGFEKDENHGEKEIYRLEWIFWFRLHFLGWGCWFFVCFFGSFASIWLLRKWTKWNERSVTPIYLRRNNSSFGL